jgi:hypothetical protein
VCFCIHDRNDCMTELYALWPDMTIVCCLLCGYYGPRIRDSLARLLDCDRLGILQFHKRLERFMSVSLNFAT